VYTDLGITKGMEFGIREAVAHGVPVEYRSLPAWKYVLLQGEDLGETVCQSKP
jgi:hypothetical protein